MIHVTSNSYKEKGIYNHRMYEYRNYRGKALEFAQFLKKSICIMVKQSYIIKFRTINAALMGCRRKSI